MDAIDRLLTTLEALGFSQTEINIFLNLKLRERSQTQSAIKIGVLECNPENLSQLSEQLRKGKGLELYSYLLDNVSQYPYNLDEDMDLIVTTAAHAEQIVSALPEPEKLARVAVRLTEETVTGLVRLPAGCRVGILTVSQRFGQLLQQAVAHYNPGAVLQGSALLDAALEATAFVQDKDAILVPAGYEKYCTDSVRQALINSGKLLHCGYEMDEGSAMYLHERLEQLKKAKQLGNNL